MTFFNMRVFREVIMGFGLVHSTWSVKEVGLREIHIDRFWTYLNQNCILMILWGVGGGGGICGSTPAP
jgi:hypothetical protein